ncbi:hypothetical protein ACWGHA_11430 [Streptomyces xanthophaeus]
MIRSAEVVNAEIRALWAGGSLPPDARDRYRALVVEWAEAVQRERLQAAVTPAA